MTKLDEMIQMTSTNVYDMDYRLLVHVRSMEFLYEIGFRGPVKTMITISNIFEMLNRNIDVDIPVEYIEGVYNTICNYNRLTENSPKGMYKKAELAEDRLEFQYKQKILRNKIAKDIERDKSNPFIDTDDVPRNSTSGIYNRTKGSSKDLKETFDIQMELRRKENSSIKDFSKKENGITFLKRRKMFEMIGDIVGHSEKIQQNEMHNTIYDDIEFDLD